MTPVGELARERLQSSRQVLAELAEAREEEHLVDLLRRVDETLAAIEVGSWGLCAVCHEPVSRERLGEDPLVSVCLECLGPEELRALERDLEGAARVQRALLPPTHLVHDGWEIAYSWHPRGSRAIPRRHPSG